jgi:hypothetical protein
MVDGRSADVSTLGRLADQPVEPVADRDAPVRELMMNTWVFQLLEPLGQLSGAFDFDFSSVDDDRDAIDGARAPDQLTDSPDDDLLIVTSLDGSGFSGRIGVPVEPADQPAVAVVDQLNRRSRQLRETARTFGVIGYVNIDAGSIDSMWRSITAAVARGARECLERLVTRLPHIDPTAEDTDRPEAERTFDVLYNFASRHLRFVRNPSGTVSPQIDDPLAQTIFEVPLFPTSHGVPVSALRLIHDYSIEAATDPTATAASRVSLVDLPPALDAWLREHLAPENIIEPARSGGSRDASDSESPADADARDLADALLRGLLETAATDELHDIIHNDVGVIIATESDLAGDLDDPRLRDAILPAFRRGEPFSGQTVDAATARAVTDSGLHVATHASPPTHLLVGDAEHPALHRARRTSEPLDDKFARGVDESTAWCLLAAFPELVAQLDAVSDVDEMQFQRRLIGQLRGGANPV